MQFPKILQRKYVYTDNDYVILIMKSKLLVTYIIVNWERLTLAFRIPAFRWLWASSLAGAAGFQPFMIGQGWLLYELTASPFMVGLAPALGAASNLILTPIWGIISDRLDRRKLMMISQFVVGISIFMIGILVVNDIVQIWHILLLSVTQRTGMSLQRTAGKPFTFSVVGRKAFMNATAAQFLSSQGAGLVGPISAGFIIMSFGVGYLFLILGFIILVGILPLFRVQSIAIKNRVNKSLTQDFREALKFVKNEKSLRSILWTVLVTESLGYSTWSMFPVVAVSLLGGDAITLGLLGTFRGLGGVVGAITISSFGDVKMKGSILWGGACLFGIALIAFSFSHNPYLSYALVSAIGIVAVIYDITANTLLLSLCPEEMRGRIMAIYGIVMTGIGFGSLGMGAVAGWLGVNWAIFGGGSVVTTNALAHMPMASIVNSQGQKH
jgi:MFS family permease